MKFIDPLLHDCGRAHNNDWFGQFLAIMQASKERYNLNGLSQAHLVTNNAGYLLRVKFPEPLHTCFLIVE